MILHCNYEELSALKKGARAFVGSPGEGSAPVAAPPVERARVEAFLPWLEGDLRIRSLSEQRAVEEAVGVVVGLLRTEMESLVAELHPADETTVAAYFDFAHGYAVQARLREMGEEMEALIEIVTGRPPDERSAREFVFPD